MTDPKDKTWTPERIEKEIIQQLRALIRLFEDDKDAFADALRKEAIPRHFLPLSGKGAIDAITALQTFQSGQLRTKLNAAIRGSDVWREKEKEKLREQYSEQKKHKK